MLSSFENKYLVTGLGYLGAFAIFAFAVIRYIEGNLELALLDIILAVLLFSVSVFIQVTGKMRLAKYGAAAIALTGPLLILSYAPYTGMLWLYVVTATFYFFLPLKQATLFAAVLIISAGVLLFGEIDLLLFCSLIVTLSLICGFSFISAINSEHFRSQLLQLSKEDALTGTGNRRAFEIHADQAMWNFKRHRLVSSLIYIDIDHFKQVNDKYGHSLGDSVLQGVVRCVQRNLRQDDHLFRLGGDEFVIIANGAKLQQAAQVAERLRQDIESQNFSEYDISLSIGISATRAKDSVEEWVARADAALYQSKEQGRNRVSIEDADEVRA